MPSILDMFNKQEEPKEVKKRSVKELLEQYPILKTLGLSAILGLTAGGIGSVVKKTTGQGPGGLLPGVIGALAPAAVDILGDSPLKRNFDRWGFPGLIKSRQSLLASKRPNKDGYIKSNIYKKMLGIGNNDPDLVYGDHDSNDYFQRKAITNDFKSVFRPLMESKFNSLKEGAGLA